MDNREYTCSICGKKCRGWGNNPWPVVENLMDRCCDTCNDEKVIPERIKRVVRRRRSER